MRLLELFDSPQPYEWTTIDDDPAVGFTTSDNVPYAVRFSSIVDDDNAYDISFSYEGSTHPPPDRDDYKSSEDYMDAIKQVVQKRTHQRLGVTGAGNEIEVMSTVIAAINEFVEKYQPERLSFSAEEPSRQKLYGAIARRFAKNWDVQTNGNTYQLSRH